MVASMTRIFTAAIFTTARLSLVLVALSVVALLLLSEPQSIRMGG